MPPSTRPVIGEAKALLLPGGGDVYIYVIQPKPCITILVHGVNDLAGVYADIEEGLCTGLNERLDHLTSARGRINGSALVPARYSLPTQDDHLAKNPDTVYYRRLANAGRGGGNSRSVVIPFYWGFREDSGYDPNTKKDYVQKDTPHGEWLDRHGNRLDKAATKEGGMFANATTTLPDMWIQGFSGMVFGFLPMNAMAGTARHPLLPAPPRNYMLLAAKRLAMLVKIIRAKHPDDTVNVVAHSQGTMLTLLANAFLKDEGQRPIDSAVLMNSPYSLIEPRLEHMELHDQQQTLAARRATLGNILRFIGERPHTTPSMADMANTAKIDSYIGGRRWTGQRCATTLQNNEVNFDERDNRGHVTLYFTPQDQTVGLRNVQGIGWQGVPDDVLGGLGARFQQRIFTLRERDGQAEAVGLHPSGYRYVMRLPGERTWAGNGQGFSGNLIKAELQVGQTVTLNAPRLPTALAVDFDSGGTVGARDPKDGIHMVKAPMDPIDASIGITNGGWDPDDRKQFKTIVMGRGEALARGTTARDIEGVLNQGKEPADCAKFKHIDLMDDGTVRILRSETPNEARQRLMETPPDKLTKDDALSFHSAIPANPEHSRLAVAYDLAIGQAKSIDDGGFYTYLCRLADWRLGWGETSKSPFSDARPSGQVKSDSDRVFDDEGPDADTLAFYREEHPDNTKLIVATANYRASGKPEAYPQYFAPPVPSLVKRETRG
ncbi:alpha/beta fold hydrolase [Dyella sp. 2YAF14]|uniref:alpha/beta fold hydrolase n=1 Tax=Dyella sp. 2YAF14 TaxID=3233025 RepID=UPI003F9096ED